MWVFFAQEKLDTAVGSHKLHMTQFVSSQLTGFFLLNLCFVSMSSSLYLLKSFSERHFLSKSMANFSLQEKILFKEYFSFLQILPEHNLSATFLLLSLYKVTSHFLNSQRHLTIQKRG